MSEVIVAALSICFTRSAALWQYSVRVMGGTEQERKSVVLDERLLRP
jgi:hypothetical protein